MKVCTPSCYTRLLVSQPSKLDCFEGLEYTKRYIASTQWCLLSQRTKTVSAARGPTCYEVAGLTVNSMNQGHQVVLDGQGIPNL